MLYPDLVGDALEPAEREGKLSDLDRKSTKGEKV
jgi:hypothetical protein